MHVTAVASNVSLDATTREKGQASQPIVRAQDSHKTRRPSTISLKHRIAVLEGMLRESGQDLPPETQPLPAGAPIHREKSPTSSDIGEAARWARLTDVNGFMPARPIPSDTSDVDGRNPTLGGIPRPEKNKNSASPQDDRAGSSPLSSDDNMSLVDRVISTDGHLKYDRSTGRLRYYGPTTNLGLSIYSDFTTKVLYESLDYHPATERIIRDLASNTHDYLMEQFWTYYNSVIHIVHKEAFYEDKQNGGNRYYSGFLHICMLATGYRSADKNRSDIKKLVMGNRESTLHREAKRIFEYEFERPGGLPTVQGLLLFSDLEACVGRDNTGWMISGM
jgi:hypothetical protein